MTKAHRLFLCALAAALAACSGCTMWKEKPANSWSNATGGEQFERLMWRDVKAQDWADLQAHLAPSFLFIGAGGSRDRTATMDYLKSLTLADYTLGDFNTTTNGSDLVVTYTAQVKGTRNGQPFPAEPVRMMTVWQQVTKSWVAIAHSETPAGSPR